ncbi:MAG: hypothetical protein EA344_10985 [Alkalicoccus sp.]|nr:MAG: hypothetical protein EA344_10985 [Alkalicoccus sp.]
MDLRLQSETSLNRRPSLFPADQIHIMKNNSIKKDSAAGLGLFFEGFFLFPDYQPVCVVKKITENCFHHGRSRI